MKRKLLFVLAVVLVMSFTLGACGSKAAPEAPEAPAAPAESAEPAAPAADAEEEFAATPEVSLILTQHDPEASLPGQYCNEWADWVYQESKGRIEVVVHNGGDLAKPAESLDKVRAGSVDLAWGLQSFYPGQFNLTEGLMLPYLPFTSSAQASKVTMDIWENTDLLADEYKDVKVILLRTNCDAPIVTTSKQLNATADLKGLTMRATAEPLIKWLAEFGAGGQGCPINELYQNLQQGTFDGALTDWHGIDSFKLYEVAKYYADEKVNYNMYYFLMNLDVYNKLSDENKAVIDACSGQAALNLMIDDWDNMTENTKKLATDNGGTVYTLPDAEHQKLLDAANTITENWVTQYGDAGKQINDLINELAPKYA